MPQKSHWPFESDAEHAGQQRDKDAEKAHAADQAAMRQRMRHDRLIVGGRAHTKKRGLS